MNTDNKPTRRPKMIGAHVPGRPKRRRLGLYASARAFRAAFAVRFPELARPRMLATPRA